MLSTRTAKNVLYIGIFAGLLIFSLQAVLGGLGALILLLLPKTSIPLQFPFPSDIDVQVNDQLRVHLDMLRPTIPHGSTCMFILLGFLSTIYAALLFQVFSRAGAFVTRLINDPFDPQTVHDLRFSTNIALCFQGLGVLGSLGMTYFYKQFDLIAQLEKTFRTSAWHSTSALTPRLP